MPVHNSQTIVLDLPFDNAFSGTPYILDGGSLFLLRYL